MVHAIANIRSANAHAHLIHGKSSGYVAICTKSDKWNEQFYTQSDLMAHMSEYEGLRDVYMSMNVFSKPTRRGDHLESLTSLYVDLDFGLINFDFEFVQREVFNRVEQGSLPTPNFMTFSGRGAHVVWLIEHEKSDKRATWQALEYLFVSRLTDLKADEKVKDVSRVLRLANTINTKSDNVTHIVKFSDAPYSLDMLAETYLPMQTINNAETRSQSENKGTQRRFNESAKVTHIFNAYSLSMARMKDLQTLVKLRNEKGITEGYRHYACFVYRKCMHYLCDMNFDDALQATLDFNALFSEPLSARDISRDTSNAHTSKRIKNETIIQWIGITREEQQHMQTLISRAEKNARENAKRKAERHAKKAERIEQMHADLMALEGDIQAFMDKWNIQTKSGFYKVLKRLKKQ